MQVTLSLLLLLANTEERILLARPFESLCLETGSLSVAGGLAAGPVHLAAIPF